LTDVEVLVLETVMKSGKLSALGVSKHTALPSVSVEPILGRLLQLRYLSRNGTRYSVEPRTNGAPTELG
jgi:DNA-binding IclR family transcriptional regulator